MRLQIALPAAVLLALSVPAMAKGLTYKEQLRQQAEHDCYGDVQKLCSNEIPNEDRIAACMGAHRTQLSSACRKAYDRGLD